MGTEIVSYEDCEKFNLNVLSKVFWGGKDRGRCCSIVEKSAPFKNVEIREEEFEYIVYKKLKLDYKERQNKDTLYDGDIRYINAIKPYIDYLENKWRIK